MENTIACHGCDLLVDVGSLRVGQKARCPRCGHFLTTLRADAVERVMAYAVAALVALIIASSFPFLSFSSSGVESVMTLPQTPSSLWRNGLPFVATLVAAFIIFIPLAVLLLLLLLAVPLWRGRARPWLKPVASWVFKLQSWSMVEVFIIGVIVSLVKIAKMATVTLGLSFWGYVAFAILFTLAVSMLDRYQIWAAIDRVEASRNGG